MFSHKKFAMVFAMALFSFLSAYAFSADKKDCVECGYKKLVGAPPAGNLDGLAKIAKNSFTQQEMFEDSLLAYCMTFEQVSHTYGFKKEMIESMKKSPYNVDRYWTSSGCRPSRIGGTSSPIIHLVAEDAAGRKQFIEVLYKYYQERKDNQTWLKVVNTKNSRGHTILDYVDYLNSSKELREEEREDVNNLISFLCNNGGVFSTSKNTCPMRI